MQEIVPNSKDVIGEFIDMAGERFYAIRNVNKMSPFFISLVSDSDHWLFVASTGGLTAGRVSPETALFPYVPVDRIYESAGHTGCKTLLRVTKGGKIFCWEPYNKDFNHGFYISQNIYKNTLGDKICFEEINHDLNLVFRYTWSTSDEYGFCRHCELVNLSSDKIAVKMIDGLQNILPAGTPRLTQTMSSNLIDAYKWNELDQPSGLAMYTVYSGITDRAQPSESLRANTVFSLGFKHPQILLSNTQLDKFRCNKNLNAELNNRGIRGAYLLNVEFELLENESKKWQVIANLEQSQTQVSELIQQLKSSEQLEKKITDSISDGSDALARIIASADGFQAVNEENVAVHHYANALFNTLRGGIFDDHYNVSTVDFITTLKSFNSTLFNQYQQTLEKLPKKLVFSEFLALTEKLAEPQISRLAAEYLPVTFGRRHGDPSRPWNQFEIKLKDDSGNRFLSYQGNWRDIFQNWEALCFSYPEFIESVIAKFVNASTVDGYNPYRITKEGIDWEVEEPEDPWSFIGYWGDHQIIYLLKMLELSQQFHPQKLIDLLHKTQFCYANVPYRIKSFESMLQNSKNTVDYDEDAALEIAQKVEQIGADGKLILDELGEVYQVNLLEKLLVPLLCKLGNLVLDGGIWLNAQRPEWNDANNALVGQGLSVVTLNYLRRYVAFFRDLIETQQGDTQMSCEVVTWLQDTASVLEKLQCQLTGLPVSQELRYQVLEDLSQAACRYRSKVYSQQSFSHKTSVSLELIKNLLGNALTAIEHSIQSNEKNDSLYHAYNLIDFGAKSADVKHLYPMLEGQVAILCSGAVSAQKTIEIVEALFESDVYRADLGTFMLYPDREQTGFLAKNIIPVEQAQQLTSLIDLVESGDISLVEQDVNGDYRFTPDIKNSTDLANKFEALKAHGREFDAANQQQILSLYEQIFNHQEFTGRSGGMFGFEGLGCVYWHMVSKLLLAVNENFYLAIEQNEPRAVIKRLGELYYRIREGIGFNKSPDEYGAFPCDPYSHTPKHAGAQQPGMTGQVKEEVLSRFGELGIHVKGGEVIFKPKLLRQQEFSSKRQKFRYLDVLGSWQELILPANSLGFTWCQVPIVYQLTEDKTEMKVSLINGEQVSFDETGLDKHYSHELFNHSGEIESIHLFITAQQLLD